MTDWIAAYTAGGIPYTDNVTLGCDRPCGGGL
jgi:hypothetical protein